MTNPIIKMVDAQTGVELEREMNAAELAQYELDAKNYQDKLNAEKAAVAAKNAVLAKIGLTADEVAALLS